MAVEALIRAPDVFWGAVLITVVGCGVGTQARASRLAVRVAMALWIAGLIAVALIWLIGGPPCGPDAAPPCKPATTDALFWGVFLCVWLVAFFVGLEFGSRPRRKRAAARARQD